ncbi:MAG: four helix bundle protein [Bacteroidetes bacterium]|nr:four helix bundle protein [Bacteroidota bacterium]
MNKKYNLEDRLVVFAGEIIHFTSTIKKDFAGNHLTNQLIRSGTSPLFNYAESQAAESRKDFIHKNKIALKELKESRVNLQVLKYVNYGDSSKRLIILQECQELIAILSTIISNAIKNGEAK